MDVLDKCREFTLARDAMTAGVYPFFTSFESNDGATARYGGRGMVMCGSNNYLGLTKDARVLEASRIALESLGSSCTGSRLNNGNLRLHEELEQQLAVFFDKPAALVFSTGYHANVGTVSALLSPSDVAILDREVHASVFDGCRMSGAPTRFFAHNDPDDLAAKLSLCRAQSGKLVIVDGVYSMGGELCPLPAVVEVCERFGARLVVDDAHGAGVLGNGRGTCADFGLTDRVDLITLTFSKAFASLGGAVVGSEDVIHYLRHHARTEIFSASITPANAAAASAALRITEQEPWRGQLALDHGRHVGAALGELGLEVSESQSPIVAVHTRDASSTMLAWRRLMQLGVYVNAVLPPAASPRLRTSYMATHERDHLDTAVAAFATLRNEGLVPAAAPTGRATPPRPASLAASTRSMAT
jgi:8-amino-7-oxononanoate synthase